MKVEIIEPDAPVEEWDNASGICVVTREPGDPKCSGNREARGESRLLYHVKKLLNARGYDLIKKRMHKDGNMVAEMQQYLRARCPTGDPRKDIAIWNTHWQIRGADADFNREGVARLEVVFGFLEKAPKKTPKPDIRPPAQLGQRGPAVAGDVILAGRAPTSAGQPPFA